MVVYNAVVILMRRANLPVPMDIEDYSELSARMQQAEWLFGREVAEQLDELVERALDKLVLTTANDKRTKLPDNQLRLGGEQKSVKRFNAAHDELRALLGPFLSLSHRGMFRKVDQFSGALTSKQLPEGMNLTRRNAKRLA